LNKTIPTFADGRNKKLLISGQKLFDRLRDSLIYYNSKKLPIILPKYFSDYYLSEKDYPSYAGTIIFFNEESVENWIQRAITEQISSYEIKPTIKESFSDLSLPYLYSPQKNLLVLIQNVPLQNGEQIALSICKNWEENKINAIPSNSSEKIKSGYKIFTISRNEKLELEEDNTKDEINIYYILRYPESGRFAAILPL
jgi:hypothetical protein